MGKSDLKPGFVTGDLHTEAA